MPSSSYENVLTPLLADAHELDIAHLSLRTGDRSRQWGIGSLNRAVVVTCLSAWEAYVEGVVKEAVESFRPDEPNRTIWQSINASTRSAVGRFNTPNVENVDRLLADSIGQQNVSAAWAWRNCTVQQARDRLTEAITLRHQIAHGVSPRPTVHNAYAQRLPMFFTRLGRSTDAAVRTYLVNELGVAHPWPA